MRSGLLFALAAVAQAQTGSISGTVVDAATHQPVKKATVTLNPVPGRIALPSGATSTDSTGAFTFDTLPEGRYILNASHQNYPQIPGGRQGKTVEVKAGEKTGSVAIELIPGAVISGHVFDEDGEPLIGCNVQAAPVSRPNQPASGSNSNQTGEGDYRIHGLAPGKYTVAARCSGVPFAPRPFSAGPDPPPSLAYPAQFYPMAADAKSAQVLELLPGVEKPGVDFRMRPAPVTQVHGRILPESRPESGLQVTMFAVAGPEFPVGGRSDNVKGTFDFDRVFPGSYYISAISNTGDPATRLTAIEPVEVKDRPVELVLTLAHGVDLEGSVTVEDNNSTSKIPLTQIQLQLRPVQQIGNRNTDQTLVKEDGSFLFKSVPAGKWNLLMFAPQMYLKSARLGGTDVTHTPFVVTAGAESLRIVASTALGTITGTAPAGQMIYAAADDPLQFQHAAPADQTGRFTIPQVPPGKYRVVATDPGTPVPDEGGQEITVHEGETVTVDVKQS